MMKLTKFLTPFSILFVYRYCMSQIENSFCVDLPSVGTIGFQPLRENKKIVYMRLSEAFLDVNQLEYAPQMAEFE